MSNDPTRAEILRAARVVFGRDGLTGATVRAIAEEAGVSRPTLYARFANLESLFHDLVEHVFDTALDGVEQAIAGGGPLQQQLERALEAYFGRLYDEVLALDRYPEFVEAQDELAGDVLRRARDTMRQQLDRILRDATPSSAAASRAPLVELLMLAPRSFKEPNTTSRQYRRRLRTLARVVATAVLA